MTNYSFEPPAKKAMDEAELSELISGLSADESGIEKAMEILQEQENLRADDERNFREWRENLIQEGSVESLRAIERVTGEVLVEPEPEPEPELNSEPTDHMSTPTESGDLAAESAPEEVDQELSDSANEAFEQEDESGQEQDQEAETTQSSEYEQNDDEAEVPVSEAAESQESDSEVVEETVLEVVEEEVQVSIKDDDVEVDYRSITTTVSIAPVADSLEQAVKDGVQTKPKKIRQLLSSKFVLGISLATAIFSSLVLIGGTYFDGNQWSNLGALAGVLLGFGLFALHGFQKTSFSSLVSQSLGRFALVWQLGVLVSGSILLVPVSNLLRDGSFFSNLEVQPARINEYLLDEVSLTVVIATLLAAVIAWQPMLRFGLLRLLALVGVTSLVVMFSGISSAETSLGEWQYQEFLLGLSIGFILVVSLALVLQPSFASDHERPSWAVGEFVARKNRVSVLHSVLFVLLPGLLALTVLSSSELGDSEWTQAGLLIAAGMSIFVVLLGLLNNVNVFLKLASLVLVSAGLIAGEYFSNETVQGLAVIGSVLLASLIGSALVIRFVVKDMQYPWLIMVSSILGLVAGWLIENPFGLLDLGFSGYQDLSGAGLGHLSGLLLAGIVTLTGAKRARPNEDS